MRPSEANINLLLLGLSRARAEAVDYEVNPWDSDKPEVRQSWNELTSPENIELLREWVDGADEMNPTARKMAFKALECCHDRFMESSTNDR